MNDAALLSLTQAGWLVWPAVRVVRVGFAVEEAR